MLRLLSILVFSLLSFPGNAAVISVDASSGIVAGDGSVATVNVPLFDPVLGELTDVSFEAEMMAEATFFFSGAGIFNGSAVAGNGHTSFNVSSFGGGLTSFSVMRAQDGAAFSTNDPDNFSQSLSGQASTSNSNVLERDWVGVGTTPLSFRLAVNPLVATSGNVFADFRDVFFKVDVRATYTFEPSPISTVPLPPALPLLAGGLGLMGFAGWRRKRKTRATA